MSIQCSLAFVISSATLLGLGLTTKHMDQKENQLSIPIAILIAGVIVAGAIVFTKGSSSLKSASVKTATEEQGKFNVNPISDKDHVLGGQGAQIFIIEYSDLECPFCKQFHATMKRVIEEYGEDGSVAWVYRHFPLDSIHSKAQKEAEGAECAAQLGGEIKFWEFVDKIFEITPSNNGLDLDILPEIAVEIGLSKEKFEKCLGDGVQAERVEEDAKSAINAGGQGTPYSIFVTKDNEVLFSIPGAVPFEAIKDAIDKALKEI